MTERPDPDETRMQEGGGRRYLDEDGDGNPDVRGKVGRKADARNRAVRTFLQGLALTVLTAVVLFLFPIFGNASTDLSTLDWRLLGLSFLQTVAAAVLSYLMRYFQIVPRTISR